MWSQLYFTGLINFHKLQASLFFVQLQSAWNWTCSASYADKLRRGALDPSPSHHLRRGTEALGKFLSCWQKDDLWRMLLIGSQGWKWVCFFSFAIWLWSSWVFLSVNRKGSCQGVFCVSVQEGGVCAVHRTNPVPQATWGNLPVLVCLPAVLQRCPSYHPSVGPLSFSMIIVTFSGERGEANIAKPRHCAGALLDLFILVSYYAVNLHSLVEMTEQEYAGGWPG